MQSNYEGESNENLKCEEKKSRTYGEFFSRGIQALVKHWRTCIEHKRDYVEK
jgi:hypothetical protein